ncbi:hypothetical protein E2562_000286 [Oryza meyeriana var. granulata]|uniref:BTB domain-containing protein n=1 Tax=Oryza meyeriana var. granulata TaxID=110450 RepID=A0A6G1CL76_9ORYZ|nr:hypothetical protein E2562_000286 [Oryza meyeriana var. granulata]
MLRHSCAAGGGGGGDLAGAASCRGGCRGATDVDIADGRLPVPVHHCILAARSTFFYNLFVSLGRSCHNDGAAAAATAISNGGGESTGRPWYKMEELVPVVRVGRYAFLSLLGYLYTGKLRCCSTWCPA